MQLASALASLTLLTAVVGAVGCELDQPFAGPGFDGNKVTLASPGPYTAVTTLITLKANDDAGSKLFNDDMTAMQNALKTQPGLVGYSLGLEIGGNTYRTMSVWESEEAMLAWVTSPTHAKAIDDMDGHVDAGSTTSWSVEKSAVPPSWDDAKAHLSKDGKKAY